MTVTLYQVGGSVRDELLGLKSKDIDFAVECGLFHDLQIWLRQNDFDVFLEQPEYMTARARFPKGFEFAGQEFSGVTADFVVCRTEAHYSDARHPDNVGVGTIDDDLARRDFTVNAMARREDGSIYDPYAGEYDLEARVLKAVGDPYLRIREDPLRILRALRFMITKNMTPVASLSEAIMQPEHLSALVQSVSEERVRDELFKMFKYDTYKSMVLLLNTYPMIGRTLFKYSDVWLKPTLESR